MTPAKPAHTPGPWELVGNSVTKWDGLDLVMEWMANRGGPNEKADARLIAAAPDLLAALEEYFSCRCDMPCSCESVFEEHARAAIARARGSDDVR